MHLQGTVTCSSIIVSGCLVYKGKLLDQLKTLRACLPPAKRSDALINIFNGCFVIVKRSSANATDADSNPLAAANPEVEGCAVLERVTGIQLPPAGKDVSGTVLQLSDGTTCSFQYMMEQPPPQEQVGN